MIKDMINILLSEDPKKVGLEAQLENLNNLGVSLKEGVAPEELLTNFSREELEEEPYSLLLSVLGSSRETAEGEFSENSDDILFLDAYCIEEADIYVEIVNRLMVMSGGVLRLEDVRASVDEEKGAAEVSFALDGAERSIKLEAEGKMIDVDLFTGINAILKEKSSEKTFFNYLSDESIFVIFSDKKSAKAINKIAGTGFYEA